MSVDTPKKFETGQPYFFVIFRDEDLRIPIISTLLFVKSVTNADGKDGFLFQELKPFESDSDEVFFENSIAQDEILDGEALLGKLKASSAGTLATTRPSGSR